LHSNVSRSYLVDIHTWRNGVDYAPLGTRAWAIQERVLSVRTLHFGDTQLYWECASGDGSEVFPERFVTGTRMVPIPKGFPLYAQETSTKERKKRITDKIRQSNELFLMKQGLERSILESDEDDYDEDDDFAEPSKPKIEEVGYGTMAMLKKKVIEIEKQEEGPLLWTLQELEIDLGAFRGLDVDFVQRLPIKNMKDFMKKLQKFNILQPESRNPTRSFEPCWIKGMQAHQRRWIFIVGAYSEGSLSFSKDKLVALSGLAQMMSKDMDSPYVAGMWRKDLEHYLLWNIQKPKPAPQKDSTRGPSWSWASVDGKVMMDHWDAYFYRG
jgi:hypothetical protein